MPSIPKGVPRRGVFFDEATWDGSDVFLIGERPSVMLSSRAARVLAESELTGISIQAASRLATGFASS